MTKKPLTLAEIEGVPEHVTAPRAPKKPPADAAPAVRPDRAKSEPDFEALAKRFKCTVAEARYRFGVRGEPVPPPGGFGGGWIGTHAAIIPDPRGGRRI